MNQERNIWHSTAFSPKTSTILALQTAELLAETITWMLQVGIPIYQDSSAGCCKPLPPSLPTDSPSILVRVRPEWTLPQSDASLSFPTGGKVDLGRPLTILLCRPGGERVLSIYNCFSYSSKVVGLGLCVTTPVFQDFLSGILSMNNC